MTLYYWLPYHDHAERSAYPGYPDVDGRQFGVAIGDIEDTTSGAGSLADAEALEVSGKARSVGSGRFVAVEIGETIRLILVVGSSGTIAGVCVDNAVEDPPIALLMPFVDDDTDEDDGAAASNGPGDT